MTPIDRYRADILRIAAEYGASNIRLSGDAVQPGAAANSDLDVLVDMDPARSLFDLVDLGRELSELLGRRVDVLAAASLSPRLRADLLSRAREL